MLDPPESIRKKFRSAVTDSGREVRRADGKPGVSNLIDILSVASGRTPEEIEAHYGDGGYGQFKQDVGDAVVDLLVPVQERYARAAGRRERAAAAARARGREGAGGIRADAAAHVREHGVRAAAVKRTVGIAIACSPWPRSAGVLHYADASPVAVFVVTGISLGGVAWAIGVATESVGARFGPAVTGVLQSTLGNLPGAVHRPLLALGRRDRGGAVLDPRLAVRERAARPRARDHRRRDRFERRRR